MTLPPLPAPEPYAMCKVCAMLAPMYGVVDFNKSCEESRGLFLPLIGVPIYYNQCHDCGMVFTTALDKWDKALYKQHIYNDEYIKVDPDYLVTRPTNMAQMVHNYFQGRTDIRLLDYGGGNGKMANLLAEKNIDAKSWDPMEENGFTPAKGTFDLVTSFEVFEHTPTPRETAEEILSFLQPEGVLLFSTLTIDTLPVRAVNFWYISPRNGHITIHTKKSLKILFGKFGYKLHHFNEGTHMAYKNNPQLPAPRAA